MFVLKWSTKDGLPEYYGGTNWVRSQKKAVRFETKAQAYAAVDRKLYRGAGGKYDKFGWVVVRLVRRK